MKIQSTKRLQLKQGDTNRPVIFQLIDGDEAVNLTGAKVKFFMTNMDETEVIVDSEAMVTDGENGIVEYWFKSGETDSTGVYKAEFEIEFPNFRKETFPNRAPIIIQIMESLRGKLKPAPIEDKNNINGGSFINVVFNNTIDGGEFTSEPNKIVNGGTF